MSKKTIVKTTDIRYRGFLIKKNPFTQEWLITKQGHTYSPHPTLEAAKIAIDSIEG